MSKKLHEVRTQTALGESRKFGTTKDIKAEGGVFYWTLGNESDFHILEAGFNQVGIGTLLPEKNTPNAALRNTLQRFFSSRGTKVEQVGKAYQVSELIEHEKNGVVILEHRPAFVVVPPNHGSNRLEFIDPDTGLEITNKAFHVIACAADSLFNSATGLEGVEGLRITMCREYKRHLNLVPAANVARALVKLVRRAQGVTLKDTGGIYWISNDHLNLWNMARIIVESASDRNKMYGLHTIIDESLCSAVCDALTSNVAAELEKIEAELTIGFKQQRALDSRRNKAAELRQKVKEYSEILGVAMGELEARVEKTDVAAAFATIAAL